MNGVVRQQRGFGLLEAIVATTVLAISGAALFLWLGQNLQTASRLRESEQRVQQQMLAEGLVASVNPAETPEGRIEQAGLAVSWRSILVAPMRDSVPFRATTPARWRVGLYRIEVSAEPAGGGQRVEFELLQTGTQLLSPATPVRPEAP